MPTNEEIGILIRLRDAASKQFKSFRSKMSAGLKGLASHWKTFAIAGGIALAGISGLMIKSAKAANIQELAERKLQQALVSTGQFTEEGFTSMKLYAAELQTVTKFGDEATIAAQSLALQMGVQVKNIPKLIQASQNWASVMGKDLNSATLDVTKAVQGNVMMLQRYGIKIDKAAVESRGAVAVFEALASFQGAAAAEAQTFGGALQQLSNVFGDFLEQIGFVLTTNESLIVVIQKTRDLFSQWGDDVKENRSSLQEFVSSGILFAVRALGFLGDAFFRLREVYLIVRAGFNELVNAWLLGWEIMFRGIEKVIPGHQGWADSIEQVRISSKGLTGDLLSQAEQVEIQRQGFKNIVQDFETSLIPTLGKTREAIQTLGPTIQTMTVDASESIKRLNEIMKRQSGLVRDAEMASYKASLKAYQESQKAKMEAQKELGESVISSSEQMATSMIDDMLSTGRRWKGNFGDILANFSKMISQMIFKALLLKAIRGALTGGVGFLFHQGGLALAGGVPEGFPTAGVPRYQFGGRTRKGIGIFEDEEFVFDKQRTREIGVGNLQRLKEGGSMGGGGGITINIDNRGGFLDRAGLNELTRTKIVPALRRANKEGHKI